MKRLLGLALLLTLVACGGGDSEPPDAQHLASELGCHYEDTTSQLFTRENGRCGDIHLHTFSGNDTRDSWLKAAESFGGMYLVGDGWVISGDKAELQAAQAKVGGEIQ